MAAGWLRGGYGAAAAACEIFLVPGQTCLASLMASTEARKFSWYPARLRRRPQTLRPLGNLQTTCLGLSDPSETFKQLVWAFPTPRKPSNNLFGPFRPLGNLQTTCLSLSDPSGRLRPPAKYSWYPASLAGVPDASEGGQTCAAGRSPPIPPIFAAGYLVYGCVASDPIPCLTTTYYSEITLTTTYNGITVWNRRASQRGEVDLV